MNWEAIGAVGEVGGAIAVVGTLVYLARQIHHSSESNRASTESFLQVEFNRMHEVLMANPDMIDVLLKQQHRDPLNATESRRFHHYANRLMNQWLAIQRAYDHGSVGDDYFALMKEDVVRACELYPDLAEEMRRMQQSYSARWEIFESIYPERSG